MFSVIKGIQPPKLCRSCSAALSAKISTIIYNLLSINLSNFLHRKNIRYIESVLFILTYHLSFTHHCNHTYITTSSTNVMDAPSVTNPNNQELSLDMYGAVSLFITEVSKQHRVRIRARRQCRTLDAHLQENVAAPHLQQLKETAAFKRWHQFQNDKEDHLTQAAKRLRSEYQKDVHKATKNIQDTKMSARLFFQMLPTDVAGQGKIATGIFDTYCKAAEKKESLKPRQNRKRKSRSQ